MVAEGHHAKAEIVSHGGIANAIHHALQRFTRAFNIGTHADGGIHHENHRTPIIAERIGISGWRGRLLRGGGNHFQQARFMRAFIFHALRGEYGQQVELSCDIYEIFGFQRNHRPFGICRCGFAQTRSFCRAAACIQPKGTRCFGVSEKHGAFAASGIIEGQHHGLLPIHGAFGAHPALRAAILRCADFKPTIGAAALARIDIENTKAGRWLGRCIRIRAFRQARAGAQDHALKQRGAPFHQQRLPRGLLRHALPCREGAQGAKHKNPKCATQPHGQNSFSAVSAVPLPARACSSNQPLSAARGASAAASPFCTASR